MKTKFFQACSFICILLSGSIKAQPADTIFYSVVKGGEKCGIQKMWMTDQYNYHFIYHYNDRGRGENVVSQITTDRGNLITDVKIDGVDYFKNPYNETFHIKGDSSISVVNGDRKAFSFDSSIYISELVPGFAEPAVKYLFHRKNGTAPVFNGGTMKVMPLINKTVSFKNQSLSLYLCEFYFNENTPPLYCWFSNDRHFFANVSDWFSTIHEGYEPLVDTLNALQEEQSKNYYINQMKALSEPMPSHFAITNVKVFDAQKAIMQENMTVLVSDGRIQQVDKSTAVKIPSDYTIIEGRGKTLMPGLWDMHAHYGKTEGLNYLAGGVTHVRDMGNSNRLPLIRDEISHNELLGPDISYLSGFIDQAGPFQGPTGAIVHNLNEGLQAVDDFAKRGYDQIKFYSSIDPAWVKPMAAEAHRLGLKACGHVPSFMTASEAIRDGYDEITHLNMVMLNFMGDTIDTRSRKRFTVVGERANKIDLNSAEVSAFINLMKEKHVSIDPTMNIFDGMFTVFPGDTDESIKPVIGWFPVDQRQDVAAQSSMAPAEKKQDYIASYHTMVEMLKKLYDNGILIVAGTDGGEAFALEHELEIYVQAGIPSLKALQCATYNAAMDCKLSDKFGTITAGRTVDLILIDGDPEKNISDIRRVEWVMKNDRLYYPKKLFSSIGWGYYY